MSKGKLTDLEIKQKFEELVEGSKHTSLQRGFEFEKLIEAKLENDKLEPRAGYRPAGEQIDGSFFWSGQTFLLEAKWVKDKLPASSIYAFKGKLDGKFHTTSGVYLAVNGYSEEVEDALKFGKSLNILLFDNSDIVAIFSGEVSFLEVLKFKLRQAGDMGSLNVPYKLKNEAKELSKEGIIEFITATTPITSVKQGNFEDLLILVEGKSDIPLIKTLLSKLHLSFSYKIVALEGFQNIRKLPSLLNLYTDYQQTKAVAIFLDEDELLGLTRSLADNVAEQLKNSANPFPVKFFFLTNSFKSVLMSNSFSQIHPREKIETYPLFNELEAFIDTLVDDYYDPEIDIPSETLHGVMESAEWDFDKGTIEVVDAFGDRHQITDIEDLVAHLDEAVIQAMDGSMPLEWLKENELDYDTEAREFLHRQYVKELEKLGWDVSYL